MRIGRFIIEQLSEGIFEVYKDGSFHKVDSSNITSKPPLSGLRKYSTNIGIDPILIRSGVHNILIDTGLGWGLDNRSNYEDTSNLKTNLDIFGLTPSDITHVISDLLMPDTNGVEFIKKVKTLNNSVKCYIHSGVNITDEIREALSKKLIDDFFEKPLNISYIYNSITSFE